MIPMLIRIKIDSTEKRKNLWLPLFLLWPFIFLALLLCLPLILFFGIIMILVGKGMIFFRLWPALYDFICSFKGLLIDVKSEDSVVKISIT